MASPQTLRPQWIAGKRVASVRTERIDNRNHNGLMDTAIVAINFDDGSFIYFVAHETEHEPYVAAFYQKARQPSATS